MEKFMVVCHFKEGTVMTEVFAVVAEEQAQVAALEAQGRIGSVLLALARGTVFIEAYGDTADQALATVQSLPMAKWWNIDVFPIAAPVRPDAAS